MFLFVAAVAVLPFSPEPTAIVVINLVLSVTVASVAAWFAARKMSTLSASIVSGVIGIIIAGAVALLAGMGSNLQEAAPHGAALAPGGGSGYGGGVRHAQGNGSSYSGGASRGGQAAGSSSARNGGSNASGGASGGGQTAGSGSPYSGGASGGPGAAPSDRGGSSTALSPPIPQAVAPSPPILLPQFPWPPPQGSASYVLPDTLFASRHTIGDASAAIIGALEQCGYVERSFFQTQDGGVALVTRLERINDDGSSVTAGKRWPTFTRRQDADLLSFLRGLFFVDPGHYRVIVFILQGQPFTESPKQATRDEARSWLISGANVLPFEIAKQSFDHGHVTAIIYEFASDGTSVLLVQSPLTGKKHLEKAGVLSLLEKVN